jgi:hypothetical protein
MVDAVTHRLEVKALRATLEISGGARQGVSLRLSIENPLQRHYQENTL